MVAVACSAVRGGPGLRDFDQARVEELAKIDELERTYWDAWHGRRIGPSSACS